MFEVDTEGLYDLFERLNPIEKEDLVDECELEEMALAK